MTRTLRVTREQLARFAAASGDRNPLHVDDEFARATPYGRCIAQGALVTTAALGVAEPAALERARSLQIQFKQPVFPDEEYAASLVRADAGSVQIEVAGGGRIAATITVASDSDGPRLRDPAPDASAATRASPRRFTAEELAAADPALDEPYACDVDELAAQHPPLARRRELHRRHARSR